MNLRRGQHYTSNTISVSRWCNQCSAFTQHAVSGNQARHCLDCLAKSEAERKKAAAEIACAPKQQGLFA